jgi:hypothetical protein
VRGGGGIPSNVQSKNKEIPAIYSKKKQAPITRIKTFQASRRHCMVPKRGGDQQVDTASKQRKEKQRKKSALVALSHMVIPAEIWNPGI